MSKVQGPQQRLVALCFALYCMQAAGQLSKRIGETHGLPLVDIQSQCSLVKRRRLCRIAAKPDQIAQRLLRVRLPQSGLLSLVLRQRPVV